MAMSAVVGRSLATINHTQAALSTAASGMISSFQDLASVVAEDKLPMARQSAERDPKRKREDSPMILGAMQDMDVDEIEGIEMEKIEEQPQRKRKKEKFKDGQ